MLMFFNHLVSDQMFCIRWKSVNEEFIVKLGGKNCVYWPQHSRDLIKMMYFPSLKLYPPLLLEMTLSDPACFRLLGYV